MEHKGIEILNADIKALGMPVMIYQTFGCVIYAYPDAIEEDEFDFVFKCQGKTVGRLSKSGELLIKECHKPDNMVISCKKCYRVCEENGRGINAFLCWGEWINERQDIKDC
ncbi:hypothetical protein OXPF_34420 [Oxobacter pfennigii]|uniref:Uncharacterized protein n=1 Tax=Oxobacter pfennigii TaxID=36849 RepID=A0A0P8W348_9CLOT|nr:hypothetical protein [Oxobacter pfennigii]KPU43010.1 hypothetical protein OXPF_34420 [Oxobacter pfennigii]